MCPKCGRPTFFKPSPVGNARNVDMKWFLHRMAEKADVEQNAQTVGKWQFSITAVRIVVLPLKWGNEKSHQLWNTFQSWWDFILYPSGISDYLLTGAALICTIGITTGNEESLWKGRMKLHVAEIKTNRMRWVFKSARIVGCFGAVWYASLMSAQEGAASFIIDFCYLSLL